MMHSEGGPRGFSSEISALQALAKRRLTLPLWDIMSPAERGEALYQEMRAQARLAARCIAVPEAAKPCAPKPVWLPAVARFFRALLPGEQAAARYTDTQTPGEPI